MKYLKLTITVLTLYCCFFLIISGCEKNPNKKIIDESQFVQIYCDVVTYADILDDNLRIALMDSILKSQNVSREEFQRNVDYYSKDSKRWQDVFSKVVEELEKREKNFSAKKDTVINIDPDQVPAVPFIQD